MDYICSCSWVLYKFIYSISDWLCYTDIMNCMIYQSWSDQSWSDLHMYWLPILNWVGKNVFGLFIIWTLRYLMQHPSVDYLWKKGPSFLFIPENSFCHGTFGQMQKITSPDYSLFICHVVNMNNCSHLLNCSDSTLDQCLRISSTCA